MPSVADMVRNRSDQIDFDAVARKFPWLFQRNLDCIVSPDSDGLLCALLMSHHLGWKVRGFYDGKVLAVDQQTKPSDCVFLDMEIFRSGVRSVGQHMLLYNRNQTPEQWHQFDQSFAVNNFRGHDKLHEFQLKYPFGTIHVLMVTLASQLKIELSDEAVAPLLFTDGTYHNLFGYTENSLNWLHYLRLDEPGNPLAELLSIKKYTITQLMEHMNGFWRRRDEISIKGERGDRIAISRRGDKPEIHNMTDNGKNFRLADSALNRAVRFIKLLESDTGWKYREEHWQWKDWSVHLFEKGSMNLTGKRLNGPNFKELIANNPLSLAITSGNALEYTLDPKGLFR